MNEKYETFKRHFDSNDLKIVELEYLITEKCNLNCKGYCSEGGPGKMTMTPQMIDDSMKPFKSINILKILGGEPSKALDIVERIYQNIVNNEIKINEIWIFTNGVERNNIEKLCEIFVPKPKNISDIYLYVSRGKYHDRSMNALGRNPKDADENIEYLRKKYDNVIFVEKQWDEQRPLNVGHARHLSSNPISLSIDTRNLIMFGENKLHKLVFSPRGFERPFFCNPEDVEKLSFGHITDDGMETILTRGLRFDEMTDTIVE